MADIEQLHIRVSKKTKDRLDQIQKEYGLGSLSAAIAWVVATDRLYTFLKKGLKDIPHLYTADRKTLELKPITQQGKCPIRGCNYNGILTKGMYREFVEELGEYKELEMFLCPKHLK